MNININIRYKTSILFFYIIFPEFAPGAGFCCFARLLALLRPPLALVGDGHPNSHATDANAG